MSIKLLSANWDLPTTPEHEPDMQVFRRINDAGPNTLYEFWIHATNGTMAIVLNADSARMLRAHLDDLVHEARSDWGE